MKPTDKQLYAIGQTWKEVKSMVSLMGIKAEQLGIRQSMLSKSEASELITALRRISHELREYIACYGSYKHLRESSKAHLESIQERLENDLNTINQFYTFDFKYNDLFYFEEKGAVNDGDTKSRKQK